MTREELAEKTLAELTVVYNDLNPDGQIKKFSCSKDKAIDRILNSSTEVEYDEVKDEVDEPEAVEPEAEAEVKPKKSRFSKWEGEEVITREDALENGIVHYYDPLEDPCEFHPTSVRYAKTRKCKKCYQLEKSARSH